MYLTSTPVAGTVGGGSITIVETMPKFVAVPTVAIGENNFK